MKFFSKQNYGRTAQTTNCMFKLEISDMLKVRGGTEGTDSGGIIRK